MSEILDLLLPLAWHLIERLKLSASLYIQIKKNSAIRHIQHELPKLVAVRLFYLGSITVTPCLQASIPYTLFSRKYRMSLHETGPWHSLFFADFFQCNLCCFDFFASSCHIFLKSLIFTACYPSLHRIFYICLQLSVLLSFHPFSTVHISFLS